MNNCLALYYTAITISLVCGTHRPEIGFSRFGNMIIGNIYLC